MKMAFIRYSMAVLMICTICGCNPNQARPGEVCDVSEVSVERCKDLPDYYNKAGIKIMIGQVAATGKGTFTVTKSDVPSIAVGTAIPAKGNDTWESRIGGVPDNAGLGFVTCSIQIPDVTVTNKGEIVGYCELEGYVGELLAASGDIRQVQAKLVTTSICIEIKPK